MVGEQAGATGTGAGPVRAGTSQQVATGSHGASSSFVRRAGVGPACHSSVLLFRDVDLVVPRFEVGEVCLDGRDVALRNENDPVAIGHVEDTT